MWNTGCNVVTNNLNIPLHIIDQEDQRQQLHVEPGSAHSFGGIIFPWCDNLVEVQNKAFYFYWTDQELLFWMFQNFRDNRVYYLSASQALAGDWKNIRPAGTPPSSYVDVIVENPFGTGIIPRTIPSS
jgi:hypothetical protein